MSRSKGSIRGVVATANGADQLDKALQADFNTTFSGLKEDQDSEYPKTKNPTFGDGAENSSGFSPHQTVLRTRNLRGATEKEKFQ